MGGYGGDYSVRRAVGCPCCLALVPLMLALLSLLAWLSWPFDECKSGTENYQMEWSQDKVNRCCARGIVPCPAMPLFIPPIQQGAVDPYNCALGYLNWQAMNKASCHSRWPRMEPTTMQCPGELDASMSSSQVLCSASFVII